MTTSTDYDWHAGIEHGISHNGYVELLSLAESPSGKEFEEGGAFRCLPLRISPDGQSLSVKTPGLRPEEEAHYLAEGTVVKAIVVTETSRMSAQYEITGRTDFKLNDEREVVSLNLRRLTEVTSAQRRNAYRVPTGGLLFERTELFDANGETLPGRLTNLSSTGAGLMVDIYELSAAKLTCEEVTLRLQTDAEQLPLSVPGVVVRIGQPEGRRVVLGLAFDLNRSTNPKGLKRRLESMRNALERAQLRRRRAS